jgi:TonB family protein
VLIAWAGGAAVAFTLIAIAFARLARVTWGANQLRDGHWVRIAGEVGAAYGVTRPVTLLQTDAPDMLGTLGWLRPRILLPAGACTWTEDRARIVLCHELAHVRRRDWTVQIGAELLRALWWFNPLFWIACTQLRRDSEQACDDEVLASGVAPREYAAQLLDLARGVRAPSPMWVSALPMARASTLERRIAAMLDSDVNRQPLSARAGWVAVTALLALALPLAAAQTTTRAARPLTGSVYDVSGAVLPQVALVLEDGKGLTLETVSDASGRFEFPPVEPGRYVLQAGLPGFRSLRYELELTVDRDWTRAVTLQVGEVKESIVISAPRPAEPRAVSPIRAPIPVRVGGNLRPPLKVRDVRPVYPDAMREAGIEGLVLLDATIAGDGSVRAVRVLSSQAHPDLAVAAVDAVRQWKFEPTLLNGTPVDVTMTVALEFKLE